MFNTSLFFTALCVGVLGFFGVYQAALVLVNHTWLPFRVIAALTVIVSVAAILALVVRS